MKLSDKLFSFIFPHKCTFCRDPIEYTNNTYICSSCLEALPYVKNPRCEKCNHPREALSVSVCSICRKYNTAFYKSYTPLLYKDSVRRALLSMKFYNKEHYCKSFAILIANSIISSDCPSFDFITYVPLSRKGFKERGYNQSEIIAKICGEILHTPVVSTLKRIDGTPKQSTLSFLERRRNAKKSFFGKDVKISGKVLLIDDIYTTGSTLNHCASVLLKMGAERVYVSAVALKTID